jgi:hypothetical protein
LATIKSRPSSFPAIAAPSLAPGGTADGGAGPIRVELTGNSLTTGGNEDAESRSDIGMQHQDLQCPAIRNDFRTVIPGQ